MSRNPDESSGRWYPVLGDRKVARLDRTSQSLEDRPSPMSHLTIQLPLPPGYQMGLDPARHPMTEPGMYHSERRSLRSMDFPKTVNREQLPPVSQLLTPSSQSSMPSSPFSPLYHLESPTSFQPSSSPGWPLENRGKVSSLTYPDGIATPPMAPPDRKLSYPMPMPTTTLPLRPTSYPYGEPRKPEPEDSSYSHYVQRSRSDPSPYQHLLSAQVRQPEQPLSYRSAEPQLQAILSRGQDRCQPEGSSLTQFAPRAVGEEIVPGIGPCYVYEDGTHCQKVIDGEPVNVNWGVTKAGRPRKRLAVACLTCREKKIKCDPNWPKCLQCDKFGRECKFQNA